MTSPKTALRADADRPQDYYPSVHQWLYAGFQRFPVGSTIALLLGYTGIFFAVWAAIGGFFVGFVWFLLLRVLHIPGLSDFLNSTPTSTNILFAFVAAVLGAGASFVFFYVSTTLGSIGDTLISIAVGIVVAIALVAADGALEESLLRARGYRRLSQAEARRVAPLAQRAAKALNLGTLPRFATSDRQGRPDLFTGMRTIVLSKGLLDLLNDRELTAAIAHELAHWRRADVVGKMFIFCAGWPLFLWFELGRWMAVRDPLADVKAGDTVISGAQAISGTKMFGSGGISTGGIFPLIGIILALPAALLISFVLVPLMAKESRRSEYAADALVKHGGLGPDLIKVLRKVQFFEAGRLGISRKLADTHPPTELRIEALEEARPDDADFREPELGGGELALVRRIAAAGLAAIVVLALASGYAHTNLPGAANIPLFGSATASVASGTQGITPNTGPSTTPSIVTPTPTPTITPTPVPTLSGVAPNIGIQTVVGWGQGLLGSPPAIHFEITLTNNASADAQDVVVEIISNGRAVPITDVDALGGCPIDSKNHSQVDGPADLANGAQVLCEPVVVASLLGSKPFHVAVFANGNSTQPSTTGNYACTAGKYGGTDCHTV
ncbi:MAG TPA: hypothetical protein DEV93_13230 [Chloroflexi bacterium]|nr:hypothetical protein [Chloroflexota bacterium]